MFHCIVIPGKLSIYVFRLNNERAEDVVMLAFQFWLFSLSAVAVSVFPTRALTDSNSAQDFD